MTNKDSAIRKIKNILIQNYYKFRIDTVRSPYQIRLRKEPYKILFILSHMRSGSSLLTHILNSNPEIIGYGETHINYNSEQDFKDLMFKVYWQIRDYRMEQKYILDKILHNHKITEEEILKSDHIYTIFLLREPQGTLNSILKLKPYWTEEKATQYYMERLSMLEKYAQIINNKKRSLLITHDQFIKNSDQVFAQMKDFLTTRSNFSEEYKILKTTGIKGIGDSSDHIKMGRILRNNRASENIIAHELLEKAEKSFHRCLAILSDLCKS